MDSKSASIWVVFPPVRALSVPDSVPLWPAIWQFSLEIGKLFDSDRGHFGRKSSLRNLTLAIPLLLAFAFLSTGCQPQAEERVFEIELHNNLSVPVTIFLTKTGPPQEIGWLSPEELASLPINQDPPQVGVVIPAGGGARRAGIVGHFWPNSDAVLRVYRNTGTLEQFAAISQGDPARLDLYLHAGFNKFIITPDHEGMSAQRDEPDDTGQP